MLNGPLWASHWFLHTNRNCLVWCRKRIGINVFKLQWRFTWTKINHSLIMGPLPQTQNCRLCKSREWREHLPRHHVLMIPTCITARAWHTCRDACRDRQLTVSLEVGCGENVPGIPDACATRNFTYLARGPFRNHRYITHASYQYVSGIYCMLRQR